MIQKIVAVLFALSLNFCAFAGLTDSLDMARTFYQQSEYERATEVYEKLYKSGYESYELFYNIGNTYYKMGDYVNSVLYYERAMKLNPDDEDLLHNIEIVRATQVDQIKQIPDFFMSIWYDAVVRLMSSNAWAWLSIVSFIVALGLVYLFLFGKSVSVRRSSFISGVFLLIISFSALGFSSSQKKSIETHNTAIIFSPSVTVKSEPSQSSEDLFVIHEGLKVVVSQNEGAWVRIKLSDGKQGWMLKEELKLI